MSSIVQGVYRHYKGSYYETIHIGRHTETQELMMVYRQLYATPEYPIGYVWIRPLVMWNSDVEWQGKTVPRFELVPNDDLSKIQDE